METCTVDSSVFLIFKYDCCYNEKEKLNTILKVAFVQ